MRHLWRQLDQSGAISARVPRGVASPNLSLSRAACNRAGDGTAFRIAPNLVGSPPNRTSFLYAIQLQLLGGIWIIRTLPAVLLSAYTRWFNAWALLLGWPAGTVWWGTAMAVAVNLTPTFPLAIGGYTFTGYAALYSVVLNLALAIVLTPICNVVRRCQSRRPASPIISPSRGGGALLVAC